MGKFLLVGLFGPPRSGKNSVVDVLVKDHGFRAYSISQFIKDMVHSVVGHHFTDDQKDAPQSVLGGATPRDLYIHFGNGDDIFPGMWVSKVLDKIVMDGLNRTSKIIIDSIGKQHQWDYIENRRITDRFYLVRIDRKDTKWDSRTPITDSQFRQQPFVIDNNGTLYDLRDKVSAVVNQLEVAAPRETQLEHSHIVKGGAS